MREMTYRSSGETYSVRSLTEMRAVSLAPSWVASGRQVGMSKGNFRERTWKGQRSISQCSEEALEVLQKK
jgi:hypothetical protein